MYRFIYHILQMASDTNGFEQGYSGLLFAPADFPDADGFDIRSVNSVVSNLTLYHLADSTDKTQQMKVWRRKVREIIQNHQEHIIQFYTNPLPTDHPLKLAHTLMQKYGRANSLPMYDITKPPPQTLKDIIVDVSGTGLAELNHYIGELEKTRASDAPLQRWTNIIRNLLDYLRDTGDELIRLDQKLQNECKHLDAVAEKVIQLTSLDDPGLDGFQDMMESYIKKQFEKHPIETLYWDYIKTVQKYTVLREILTTQRIMNSVEPLCCVCMTEPVIMAFAPCGHTFCTNCSKRTYSCHVCRQVVVSRIKLFFT